MKFLDKNPQSRILTENMVYRKNAGEGNKRLAELLAKEQYNFCAYTEKYLSSLDSVEVEHINADIKYNDDYFNYYAVIRKANQTKKDKKYKNASFFENRFFQNRATLNARIAFKNNSYYEINEADTEARDFIDFLDLNHPSLAEERNKQINRLKNVFRLAQWSAEQIRNYFQSYKEELSFCTAIEHEFGIDTEILIKN